MVAAARGATLRADALAVAADVADDPSLHLYALAARVPMGQADRYAVLCAPTLAERVDVLTDAIETVSAMVEFQLAVRGVSLRSAGGPFFGALEFVEAEDRELAGDHPGERMQTCGRPIPCRTPRPPA